MVDSSNGEQHEDASPPNLDSPTPHADDGNKLPEIAILQTTKAGKKKSKGLSVPSGKTHFFDLEYSLAAALCYFPIVGLAACVLWLKTESGDNKYLKFHAIQGILCFAVFMIISVITGTVEHILSAIPVIGAGLGLLLTLIRVIIFFVYAGMSVMQASAVKKGKSEKMPLIGNYTDSFVNPPPL
ncbi:MAG: hypothetical protein K2X93_07105 [Candidatus Obscuribacterales bacterium]|nr:hypothetical protein [Candidatus Obscuribacterales bacterium]